MCSAAVEIRTGLSDGHTYNTRARTLISYVYADVFEGDPRRLGNYYNNVVAFDERAGNGNLHTHCRGHIYIYICIYGVRVVKHNASAAPGRFSNVSARVFSRRHDSVMTALQKSNIKRAKYAMAREKTNFFGTEGRLVVTVRGQRRKRTCVGPAKNRFFFFSQNKFR